MTIERPASNSAQRRSCPICATTFAPHPRKPDQTYCSERCRNTAWRRSHPHRRRAAPTNLGHQLGNEVDTQVRHTGNATNQDANEVNAVRRCPHCQQPISLITLIVPPAAAVVTVPSPPTTGARHDQ